MNSMIPTEEKFHVQLSTPAIARWCALLALPLLVAAGMLAPQLRAGALYLDFATDGGVTTATGWTPVYQAGALAGLTNVGGSGYNFSFINIGAYQGGDATQTLTRSGFHNGNNYVTPKTFTLSGLNPNKPVKLYACAAWDGNGAGGYLVYGDTGAAGLKAETVGNPETTGNLTNLTYIGTATADGAGAVTGDFWGRYSATATGNAEGQVGAFAFIPTQILTASAGANGAISPSGESDAFAGISATYTMTADSGYHISDVLVDGVSVGAISSYTITHVTANHTISASFAIDTVVHTITASAGANGSISPSGAVSANQGVNKPFAITPNTGYHIADVLVDGASVGAVASYTFTNVTANHSISASFAINTYTLTASAGANGSISPAGTTNVNHDGSQQYTITPAPGYYIADVRVDDVPVGGVGTYSFENVTANHTITASFDNRTRLYLDFTDFGGSYTSGWTPVHASITTDTTVNVSNVGGTDYGFTFDHVAVWDNDVEAQSLTRSGFYNFGGVNNAHPFTLTGLVPGQVVSLYACAAWDGNGNGAYLVYGDTGAAGVRAQTVGNPGTSPSLGNLTLIGAATADANGTVAGSMHGGAGVGSALQGQVGGFVFAIEAPPVWTITASAGGNGSISPGGAVSVNSGESAGFTITANSGYHVADVLVDGVTVGAVGSYTFNTVTTNHTISASFAINSVIRTITASAGANGSINPSGAVSVNQGVTQVFTIEADTGFHVADVLVDGASVGPVSSYTFTNVDANHTISSSFAIDTFTITATAGANGSISPSGPTSVEFDAYQEFTIAPAPGYQVDEVFVDGVSIGAVTGYTFFNVTENHSITASFDNRTKVKLDFTQQGGYYTNNWTPVFGEWLNNTVLASTTNVGGLGYGFSIANVGCYDNGLNTEPLTRSGFYTNGNNTLDHTFTLTGLNAGQSVTLYACAGWDGNARGGHVVFGDSGPTGVKAQTIGTPGTSPTIAHMTLIGTATADGSGTVTGSLHGAAGVDTNEQGQVGGFVFAISAGGAPVVPYDNWATSPPNNLAGNDALATSDPDFDGVPNLVEFALNGSPIGGASRGRSFAKLATVDSVPNVLTLTIAVRSGATFLAEGNRQTATIDGITYTVEASNGLGDWGGPVVTEITSGEETALQAGLPTPDAGWVYKTFRTDGSSASDSSDFIRVGVE